MFTRRQLESAHEIVGKVIAPTPLYCWPLLCQALGAEVWVKHENHTPTGAFKVRGGVLYLHEATRQPRPPKALITATRGNHGQSIPFAARTHNIPVTVLVPRGNSSEKNAAMAGWGATVEVIGTDFDEARVAAERRAADGEATLVASFHEHLVRGVASYALELFAARPELATVYVPIGMGSGICGVISARDALNSTAQIVGVVSDRADGVALSFEAGRVVETPTAHTFADGIACRVPSADALAVIARGAARIVRVSDDEIAAAVRLLYTTTHNVAEGAGAAACAAAFKEKRPGPSAVILSGGNVDRDWLGLILAGSTPSVDTPAGHPS